MQAWEESLRLAKEQLLDRQSENTVSLISQGEAEVGFGEDQPTRNTSADRNDEGPNEPLVPEYFGSLMPEKT